LAGPLRERNRLGRGRNRTPKIQEAAMSLMAIYRSTGVDRAKYDAVINELDSKRTAEPGAIVHLAGFLGPDEICVVDVWESREQFEKFGERLRPVLQKHGIPEQTPEIVELYGLISYPPVDAYKPQLTPA
jgi:hypothetical protein